jgi:adenylylsulfate kinase-like enzyme
MARDPKGIYRSASANAGNTVPGLRSPYEPPEHPDVVVCGGREAPPAAAACVLAKLAEKGYVE